MDSDRLMNVYFDVRNVTVGDNHHCEEVSYVSGWINDRSDRFIMDATGCKNLTDEVCYGFLYVIQRIFCRPERHRLGSSPQRSGVLRLERGKS